jgi:hypothetical protein
VIPDQIIKLEIKIGILKYFHYSFPESSVFQIFNLVIANITKEIIERKVFIVMI